MISSTQLNDSGFESLPSDSQQVPWHSPTTFGPIESEMRAKIDTLVHTTYRDNFDWSIYDRIGDRFEGKPRGGVVFKTGLKLLNHHSSCSKCHYSFEIDTYGRGCFHNCTYCYAKEQLTSHGYWNKPQPFPVDLSEIRKIFYTVFETGRSSKWRKILESQVPLRIGSMSDSFMWMDTKYGVTKELLKILKHYRYPHIIFTRSDLVAHDEYLNLLDINLCSVQFSISGNNNEFTRKIEPGAPSYRRRLAALKKLSDAGFWTTVRINPLFPRYPDGFYSDPDSIKKRFGSKGKVPILNFYNDDFVSELAETGTPSVLAGFVRLTVNAINEMSKASGINIREFYKNELWEIRGQKRYSDDEIGHYYRFFHQECKKNNLRFNTCYIGNGLKDYYQYQSLWDNKKDCCDAVGNVKFLVNTAQSISWEDRSSHSSSKTALIHAESEEKNAEYFYTSYSDEKKPVILPESTLH